MISARLKRALAWRFDAITSRLDALHGQIDRVDLRLDALDGRLAETQGVLDRLDGLAAVLPQAAENAAATREALADQVQPVLRAIVDGESENRRRLFALRSSPAHEQAYADPHPLVSVTVATVGGRDALIDRALPSLLSQSYTNLEVLVVGDATAPEVSQAVAALGDSRVQFVNLSQRLVAHPDPQRHWLVGSTMARNEASRRARGQWLLHFDDDDQLRPDTIAALLELARETRAEVAYGGFEHHHPTGASTTHIDFPPQGGLFAWPTALMHGGLRFFERELVAVHLGLPGDVYMLERMLRVGVRFAMLDEIVLDYFPSTRWEPAGDSGETT
jgi:Glycosyl transferase family 2